ncbi:hypothetical protein Xmlh_08310 [Xanthomonas axonopodis pv. melhusii]|uniref:Uncharacterized protein n=1 Tax=Xanthomonas axonopodis pv. melhusii TaxID=487834 RepID=A0A1T1P7P5_9XANT|nr:hypothetical protein [Xanthomonas axonopodis]OOW71466.1 hypothetical protein Xmlh_08310 [Xanthomonas axonopodis pv. melhusii]
MEEEISLKTLNAHFRALAEDHNVLVARTTAMQSVLEVLAWGVWHERDEIAQRLLQMGAQSIEAVNQLPPRMQQEVVAVWNQAYKQLADPDAEVSIMGVGP